MPVLKTLTIATLLGAYAGNVWAVQNSKKPTHAVAMRKPAATIERKIAGPTVTGATSHGGAADNPIDSVGGGVLTTLQPAQSAAQKREILLAANGTAAQTQATTTPANGGMVGRTSRGPLVAAYLRARQADPVFRGASAERDTGLIGANVASVAYYPQLSASASQLETEGGSSRRSISLIQPLFSIDRYATMKEADPRRKLAEANYQSQGAELAKRVYLTSANVIRARESHNLNQIRISTVEQHKRAAKRSYELGQGTLTDVRDTEVKALQATADDHKLRAQLAATEREYASITGEPPPAFRLVDIAQGQSILPSVARENPALTAAREHERIGELAVLKAKSAWLPNVNAQYTMTDLNGKKDNFVGISLTMPLQVGGIIGTATAGSQLTKLREDTLEAERKYKLETRRLFEAVQSGFAEVQTRRVSIEAAQLSVEATEKSFKGGVRSMVDLLNAIEVVFRIKNEYVQTVLALGDSLLQLRLQEGGDPLESLQEVDALILP